jgi:hypothetical protein
VYSARSVWVGEMGDGWERMNERTGRGREREGEREGKTVCAKEGGRDGGR